MKPISSPWALVRHIWGRNFQQNPVRTVIGSLLAMGGVGLLLFFGFFVVMTFFVVGGLLMLANALFGAPRRQAGWPGSGGDSFEPSGDVKANDAKPSNNKALEGEYTVVSDDESGRPGG